MLETRPFEVLVYADKTPFFHVWILLSGRVQSVFIPVAFEYAWGLAARIQVNHIVLYAHNVHLLAADMHLPFFWVYVV